MPLAFAGVFLRLRAIAVLIENVEHATLGRRRFFVKMTIFLPAAVAGSANGHSDGFAETDLCLLHDNPPPSLESAHSVLPIPEYKMHAKNQVMVNALNILFFFSQGHLKRCELGRRMWEIAQSGCVICPKYQGTPTWISSSAPF